MLVFLAILLVWASINDLAKRIVSNKLLALIAIVVIYYAYEVSVMNICSFLWSGVALFSGVFLSRYNIIGGADSKLIAILLLAISEHYLILFPAIFAVMAFLSIVIFWGVSFFYPIIRSKGFPFIPAISLAGFLCIWIG